MTCTHVRLSAIVGRDDSLTEDSANELVSVLQVLANPHIPQSEGALLPFGVLRSGGCSNSEMVPYGVDDQVERLGLQIAPFRARDMFPCSLATFCSVRGRGCDDIELFPKVSTSTRTTLAYPDSVIA